MGIVRRLASRHTDRFDVPRRSLGTSREVALYGRGRGQQQLPLLDLSWLQEDPGWGRPSSMPRPPDVPRRFLLLSARRALLSFRLCFSCGSRPSIGAGALTRPPLLPLVWPGASRSTSLDLEKDRAATLAAPRAASDEVSNGEEAGEETGLSPGTS